MQLVKPSPGRIVQGFGPRPKPTPTSPATHYGIDYGWGNGKQVVAAAPGVVRTTGSAGAYGNRIIISHDGLFETWYAHLSVISVREGQRVQAGTPIGVQGATGNVTGVHLHFELRYSGVAIDPQPYFTDTAGGGVTPIDPGQPTEEDDMYNDSDRYQSTSTNQAVGRLEQAVFLLAKNLNVAQADLDRIEWGVLDDASGLRRMVANLGVIVGEGGVADQADLDALIALVKSLPTETVAAIKAAL